MKQAANSLSKKALIGAVSSLAIAPAAKSDVIKDQYLVVGGYDDLVFELKNSDIKDRIVGLSFDGSPNIRCGVSTDGSAFVKMSGDLCLHRCTIHTQQEQTYKLFIQVNGWGGDDVKRFVVVPKTGRLGFELVKKI